MRPPTTAPDGEPRAHETREDRHRDAEGLPSDGDVAEARERVEVERDHGGRHDGRSVPGQSPAIWRDVGSAATVHSGPVNWPTPGLSVVRSPRRRVGDDDSSRRSRPGGS